MKINAQCRMCGAEEELEVSEAQLQAWQDGALIQKAMPHLTKDQRELLITGTCGTCFDRMFEET